MDEPRESFGKRLRGLRESRGLTRQDVAGALKVDVTTVRGWENDRFRPRPPKLKHLAKLLRVEVRELTSSSSAAQPLSATLVDTLSELPDLLDRLLAGTMRVLKALRIAAPYATPVYLQRRFRRTLSRRLLAGTIEVQRVEIIYDLDRLKEVVSNILRYRGCAYHAKAYCPGLTEVAPAMGGYFFDDEEFLIGAYSTSTPPHNRPVLHLSGEPFRSYFRAYWGEIWRRGTLLTVRGPNDLSACREIAVALGLPPAQWPKLVEQARHFEVGDGAPPLV